MRAPQEFFCVGSALYPRPIPYEICPEIRSTQCSISTCLKMCIFWKFRKMSKTSVVKGLFQQWLTNCDPKPWQIRCQSDYWDFKPKSIRFGVNLTILQNKELCRVAWSPKYSKSVSKNPKNEWMKIFFHGVFCICLQLRSAFEGVLRKSHKKSQLSSISCFVHFRNNFWPTPFLHFLAAGLIFQHF